MSKELKRGRSSGALGSLAAGLLTSVVLIACASPGWAVSQCSDTRISWPADQCTLPCPAAVGGADLSAAHCELSNNVEVQVGADTYNGGTHYCCACIERQLGVYEARLCAGSALPAPSGIYGTRNNTFPMSATRGDATFDVSPSRPVYVKLGEANSWLPFTYMYLTVESANMGSTATPEPMPAVPAQSQNEAVEATTSERSVVTTTAAAEVTTPAPSAEVNATNSSSSRRLLALPSQAGLVAEAERMIDSRRRALHLSRDHHVGSIPDSVHAQSPVLPGSEVQLTQFHMKGAVKQGTNRLESLETTRSNGQPSLSEESGSRRSASGAYVDLYLLDGGYPVVQGDKPYFLYHVTDNTSIYVIEPVNSISYYVMLRANGANFKTHLKTEQKLALELIDAEETVLDIQAGAKQFTYYRPPHEGISLLKVNIVGNHEAIIRVWVGANALATARLWQKWLEASAGEMNALTDNFYTSIQMETERQPATNYATWTIESSMPAQWKLEARTVAPRPLRKDTKIHFTVDQDLLIGLLVLDVTPEPMGRLFFQVMPGMNQQAYSGWEDLQHAVKLRAVTRVNGELTYYQLSDWGYTTDGTAALQVMVSQWDPDENVYLHIYLRKGAPSNSFTVVCYHIGDGFEAWKWWFGGIIFALFILCIARCILCRRRPGVIFFRNRSYRARNLNLDTGEMQIDRPRTPPPEEVTTTEPIPEKLKKVADTLYKRLNQTGAAADSVGEASPVEEINEDGEEDVDDSCIICLDRTRDAILLECGHGGLCVQCADMLWNLGVGHRNCPMCRKTFTGVMKILKEDGTEATVEPVHYAMAKPKEQKGRLTGMREAFFSRFRGSGRGRAGTEQDAPSTQGDGGSEAVIAPLPQSRDAAILPVVATQNSASRLEDERPRNGTSRASLRQPSSLAD